MEHIVAFTGNNLRSEGGRNLIKSLGQSCLKFQAEVIGFTVTQSTEDSGKLFTAVEVAYAGAEEDVFWQLPLSFCHSTADVLEQ